MTEQSSSDPATSAGTTLRALVMLLCLVALPIVAFRGTKWSDLAKTLPEIAKRALSNRWISSLALAKESQPDATASESGSATDPATQRHSAEAEDASPPPAGSVSGVEAIAPRRLGSPFAGVVEQTPPRTPDEAPPSTAALQGDRSRLSTDSGPTWPERTVTREWKDNPTEEWPGRRASWQQPEPDASRLHEGLCSRDSDPSDPRRPPLVPVARRDRAWPSGSQPEPPPLQNAVIRPDQQPLRTADPTDRFLYVMDRLRELGAVYYLLETWGNDGQRFRFHCKMAVAGNPSYTRHFEAIDRDALQSMARVLAEVEAWRASR